MNDKAMTDRNQTGVDLYEDEVEAMNEAKNEFPPTSTGTKFAGDMTRVEYARELDDDELHYGSVPKPLGLAGKAKAAIQSALGLHPRLLVDKLGERLAFERTGTRLYEVVISKHEAFGSFDGGPTRAELLDILNEEHRHFRMLVDVIESLGGDPVAVTPSADLVGVIGSGIVKVVSDPRTTLLDCLEAILVAELADKAGWQALIDICHEAGKDRLAMLFEQAARTEEEHLAKVQRWIAAGQERSTRAEAAQ